MLSDFADSQDLSKQKLNLVILFPLNAEKINTNLDKELKDTDHFYFDLKCGEN